MVASGVRAQARLFLGKGESKVVCKEHFQSLRPLFGPQALPWQIAFDDKWFILEIYQDRDHPAPRAKNTSRTSKLPIATSYSSLGFASAAIPFTPRYLGCKRFDVCAPVAGFNVFTPFLLSNRLWFPFETHL